VPILIGTFFAPESPWWLVRHERFEDAKRALLKLTSTKSGIPYNIDNQVAMIKATDAMERAMSEGTNYWDCFKGVDLRRTEM
jgi:MFS transporter, SP family, general alpha glucoside:H+ symporter